MTKLAYAPHKLSADTFRALGNNVLVSDMSFDQRITSGGLILLNDNGRGSGIRPRWGKVYAIGPDQTDVRIGQWICIAHGRWTRGIEIEDNSVELTIRRVDPDDILLIADHKPDDDTQSTAVNIDRQDRFQ
jgi:hypothetical protein